MSEHLPTSSEALYLLVKVGCPTSVIEHCKVVSGFAKKVAKAYAKRGYKVDVQLIEIGGLLHDIGRSKTHTINHALIGGQIARSLGLPKALVSIIENHAGGGISKEEAKQLGWPIKNYWPKTLEEKIVCYADKRVAGLGTVPIEQTIKVYASNLGENHPTIKRIMQIDKEITTIVGELYANSDTS